MATDPFGKPAFKIMDLIWLTWKCKYLKCFVVGTNYTPRVIYHDQTGPCQSSMQFAFPFSVRMASLPSCLRRFAFDMPGPGVPTTIFLTFRCSEEQREYAVFVSRYPNCSHEMCLAAGEREHLSLASSQQSGGGRRSACILAQKLTLSTPRWWLYWHFRADYDFRISPKGLGKRTCRMPHMGNQRLTAP